MLELMNKKEEKEAAVAIIVAGEKELSICADFNMKYLKEDAIIAIPANDPWRTKARIYILMGEKSQIPEDYMERHAIVLDFSDEVLKERCKDDSEICNLRMKLMERFAEVVSEDALIGLDVEDLQSVLKENKQIHWGLETKKHEMSDEDFAKQLMQNAGVNASECKKLLLHFVGDFALIDVMDTTQVITEYMDEKTDVIFSAKYDETMSEEYHVLALFVL